MGRLTYNMHNSSSRIKVAILGATGMVGRRLAQLLIDHPRFELGMLAGSEQSAGVPYRAVWEKKEKNLEDHYPAFWRAQSFPEALRDIRVAEFRDLLNSDIEIVFSSMPEYAGSLEDQLLCGGRVVFSNSVYRRFDENVPLIVAEVNGHTMKGDKLVKNPNCVTSGLALVLEPIRVRFGLEAVVVTTYQSLSGRGDAKYAPELVVGNIYPLHESKENTEGYIQMELTRIFGNSFASSITCNRTYVQEGHFVEVRIKTGTPITDVNDVAEILSAYHPLKGSDLHTSPEEPIVVLHQKGRPRPRQDAHHYGGMAIAVGNISIQDDIFDLRLTYVVNNLVRGAAGGALLNAELWLYQKSYSDLVTTRYAETPSA
jgi:aspartate-semialdehyde dehydrogenase